jgi:hypothetical protein
LYFCRTYGKSRCAICPKKKNKITSIKGR